MPCIALRLHPDELENPDTDLRYLLPDAMIERSNGVLSDDGWGYEGEPPYMVMFLQATDLPAGLFVVMDVINNVRIKDNDFRGKCVVAIQHSERDYEVVYPPDFEGRFNDWQAEAAA